MQHLCGPQKDAEEATSIAGVDIFPVGNLKNLYLHLSNQLAIPVLSYSLIDVDNLSITFDHVMTDIKGQEKAKRALEIAVAGSYNMLLKSPQGSGKTLLARAAQNPCPCGYLGDNLHECTCAPSQIIRYHKGISSLLLDRINIHVEIPAVKTEKLTSQKKRIQSKTQQPSEQESKKHEIDKPNDLKAQHLPPTQTCKVKISSFFVHLLTSVLIFSA